MTSWEDIGSVETIYHFGGAIVQTRRCVACGKRYLRKTNSINCSQVAAIKSILDNFLNNKKLFNTKG